MSIRPVSFNPDGSIEVVYDETDHQGTIPAADISWVVGPDGSEDHNFIVLECPDGCGASSTHPVGGGAAPAQVQEMFVERASRGCACGEINSADRVLAESHVRLACNRMDGPSRWQIDPPALVAQLAASPDTIRVVYRYSDRLIVGGEPTGPITDPNYGLEAVPASEYQHLVDYDPAYLAADSEHIQATPPW